MPQAGAALWETGSRRGEPLADRDRARNRVRRDSPLLAADFRDTPYWWDDLAPPAALPEQLPSAADVVVVGSGYTGLNAALETARGGRSTVVLDAGDPGWGCSTRNGGQISTSVKPSMAQLARRHGPQRAWAIRQEGVDALEWIERFVAREGIDCDFRRAGRFHAAHTPRHYEALARTAATLAAEEGMEAIVVPRREQQGELGTATYHGGLVYPRHASLHPAKYHRGLLSCAQAAGVAVVARCEATAIARVGQGFRVSTSLGDIRARDLVVATNGYTSGLTPWLRRRVIPIGSYMIATEPLARPLMDRLFPTDRVVSDTCRVVYYYRPSPDRTRILFGGRVSARESDPLVSGPLLHADLCRIFPELAGTRISHSWTGTVAYSFDHLPHTGTHEGIHFAMSYCGSGVSMASYLGMRLGQKVLGEARGRTAFDDLTFPTRPLYTGVPWFLPTVVAWYRARDRRERRRAAGADREVSGGATSAGA